VFHLDGNFGEAKSPAFSKVEEFDIEGEPVKGRDFKKITGHIRSESL
jgi:hypothetical protein